MKKKIRNMTGGRKTSFMTKLLSGTAAVTTLTNTLLTRRQPSRRQRVLSSPTTRSIALFSAGGLVGALGPKLMGTTHDASDMASHGIRTDTPQAGIAIG